MYVKFNKETKNAVAIEGSMTIEQVKIRMQEGGCNPEGYTINFINAQEFEEFEDFGG